MNWATWQRTVHSAMEDQRSRSDYWRLDVISEGDRHGYFTSTFRMNPAASEAEEGHPIGIGFTRYIRLSIAMSASPSDSIQVAAGAQEGDRYILVDVGAATRSRLRRTLSRAMSVAESFSEVDVAQGSSYRVVGSRDTERPSADRALTVDESRVFSGFSAGMPIAEIAQRLSVSVETVRVILGGLLDEFPFLIWEAMLRRVTSDRAPR